MAVRHDVVARALDRAVDGEPLWYPETTHTHTHDVPTYKGSGLSPTHLEKKIMSWIKTSIVTVAIFWTPWQRNMKVMSM